MALYKAEKVNPLGGCLPLVIQMPIFLALYYMLSGSVELRHAPFVLWIHDLSAQDPYYILPVIMGITMFFIQKMSPTTVTDPMQQKIMTYMPVIFTVFFLWFPSGLVLYYIVSNLVTILQQQLIYRGLEKRGLQPRQEESVTPGNAEQDATFRAAFMPPCFWKKVLMSHSDTIVAGDASRPWWRRYSAYFRWQSR